MDLQDLLDGAIDIIFARCLRMEDFNRESTAGDRKRRCIAVETRELDEIVLSLPCF